MRELGVGVQVGVEIKERWETHRGQLMDREGAEKF